MQLEQIVAFVALGTPTATEDLAETLSGDDQRIVYGFQVGGDQTVGFVIVGHQCLQRGRGSGRGGPEEPDLTLLLDDPRPHEDFLHSITRLLPESDTASVSPRIDMP